jgi:hypothetical protein
MKYRGLAIVLAVFLFGMGIFSQAYSKSLNHKWVITYTSNDNSTIPVPPGEAPHPPTNGVEPGPPFPVYPPSGVKVPPVTPTPGQKPIDVPPGRNGNGTLPDPGNAIPAP